MLLITMSRLQARRTIFLWRMELYKLPHLTIDNYILTCTQLSNLDKKAYEKNSIPLIVLMEEASSQIINNLKNDFPDLMDENIAVVAGWGNNGGDALSVCRKLFFNKIKFDVYIFNERKGSELFESQKKILESLQIRIFSINEFESKIKNYSLIIDGIFGIGYKYKEDEKIEKLFNLINSSGAKIVSVDVPSGLNTLGKPCIKADLTYSIGFVKDIFFNPSSRKNVGLIRDLKISFYINNIKLERKIFYLNEINPLRKKTDNFVHKYSKGGVISIGGQPGKFGSILFSAESSLNAGAGISLIITDNDNVKPMNTMTKKIIIDSFENLGNYSNKYKTILIGPGINLSSDKNRKIVEDFIKLEKQFILDASFFSAFDKSILKSFKMPPILTPHSQEFKTFFKEEAETLNNDAIISVINVSMKYKAYILLKESFLIFSDPKGNTFILDRPNRILAQAGSGDILAGIISGVISQGFEINESILEAIRVFYKIAQNFSDKGYASYSPENFISLIKKYIFKE